MRGKPYTFQIDLAQKPMLSKRKEASFVDVAVFNGMRIICDCVNDDNGKNVTTSAAPKVLQCRAGIVLPNP